MAVMAQPAVAEVAEQPTPLRLTAVEVAELAVLELVAVVEAQHRPGAEVEARPSAGERTRAAPPEPWALQVEEAVARR
jgi:hypothetical protein